MAIETSASELLYQSFASFRLWRSTSTLPFLHVVPSTLRTLPLASRHARGPPFATLPLAKSFCFSTDLDSSPPFKSSPLETFVDFHRSFFESLEARNIPSILRAGSVARSSAVFVLLGSEAFVDQLCRACSASVEVAHFSLEVLAGIKEKHDDVRCWCLDVADSSEVSGSFDTIFLNYFPIFTVSLTKLLKDVTRFCKPGGTVVISLTQDRRGLLSVGEQSPGVLRSPLPDRKDLVEMVSALPFEIVEFEDVAGFYLVALKLTGPSHTGVRDDADHIAVRKEQKEFPLHIRGEVIYGFGRGSRQLGFPTANLSLEALPSKVAQLAKGVYYGWAQIIGSNLDSSIHKMVMNVGNRPTFEDDGNVTLEVHIIHKYGGDFYGKELRVAIIGFIREEMRFSSVDELIKRIQKDIEIVQTFLLDEDLKVLKMDPFFLS